MLTDEQAEQAEHGPKFADVRPEQLFGPAGDGALASRIARLNIARYRELHQQYLWDSGQEKRPANFYD
jgi:hypothetical protein